MTKPQKMRSISVPLSCHPKHSVKVLKINRQSAPLVSESSLVLLPRTSPPVQNVQNCLKLEITKKKQDWSSCFRLTSISSMTSLEKYFVFFQDLSHHKIDSVSDIRDVSCCQNGWIFGKVPKGGGVIFNPKIYIAKFGPLSRAIWPWNWYKGVFSGYVFQQLYW